MALVLKTNQDGWEVLENASEVYVKDTTQDYVDGSDGGWGTTEGGLIDREDRCLLCFAKYTDYEGTESYLAQKLGYTGSDTSYAIAPGAGLSNTSQSQFTVLSVKDGHHTFFTYPMVQASSNPSSPSAYDLYYNTTSGLVYVYVSSAWTLLTSAHLSSIEGKTGMKQCDVLLQIRIKQKKNELRFRLGDDQISDDVRVQDLLDEINGLYDGAVAKFGAGLYPIARRIVEVATTKSTDV